MTVPSATSRTNTKADELEFYLRGALIGYSPDAVARILDGFREHRDAALSEERRLTVAAIRQRLAGVTTVFQDDWQHESGYDTDEVNAILDEIVRPDTDEPDFGRCCGNYLDTGECCAAAYGTANLR